MTFYNAFCRGHPAASLTRSSAVSELGIDNPDIGIAFQEIGIELA
jgi:hypothetical protein